MAANVTVLHTAFSDWRYDYLAEIAGLSDADHARGRMLRIWSLCTEKGTDTPPIAAIATVLGPRGDELLVRSELGERLADGRVRVRGCDGQIEWYGDLKRARSEAGKKRIATAERDARGRLVKRPGAGPAQAPAPDQPDGDVLDCAGAVLEDAVRHGQDATATSTHRVTSTSSKPPAPVQHPSSTLQQSKPNSGTCDPSLSGSGSMLVNASPDPEPGSPREHDPAREDGAAADDRASSRVFNVSPPGVVDADPALIARRTQGHRAWDHLNAMRRELATELGLPEPMHLHDQLNGRRDLADRLRDAGSERAAELELEHVFAVATAEVRAKRTLRWMGPAMFKPDAWGRMLAMDPSDVRAPIARPDERNVFDEVDRATAMIVAAQQRKDPT